MLLGAALACVACGFVALCSAPASAARFTGSCAPDMPCSVSGALTFSFSIVPTATLAMTERPTGIDGAYFADLAYENNAGHEHISIERTYLVVSGSAAVTFVALVDDIGVMMPRDALVYRLIPGDESRALAFVARALKRSSAQPKHALVQLLRRGAELDAAAGIGHATLLAGMPREGR